MIMAMRHPQVIGRFFTLVAMVVLVLSAVVPVGVVRAAEFNVTNTNDSGPGSLRQAILDANATPGPDTISLVGVTGTITLTTGQLSITDDVTITGPGTTVLTISGNNLSRIFDIASGTVEITQVTLSQGKSGTDLEAGNAVRVATSSALTLWRVTVSNNGNTGGATRSCCGAIASSGTLNIFDSTFNGNTAGNGGAVYASGNVNIERSTFSSNATDANAGGALYASGGTWNITNSTISGNATVSGDLGGGLVTGCAGSPTVIITNSTIVNNSAGSGGGLRVCTGSITTTNSIIANNTGGNCVGVISSGYNLSSDSSCGGATGDLTNTSAQLGPLQNNGGATFTHAPLAGSPAIDAGSNSGCPATDQRGIARPQGAVCDIGAVEFSLPAPKNTDWTTAKTLTLSGTDDNKQAVDSQYLTAEGQSLWYKVNVSADSNLIVELCNLPANYDLVLYRDINAIYHEFTTTQNPNRLSARFAPVSYSPVSYSPVSYSPVSYSPVSYSPVSYSPVSYSPVSYSPVSYSPLEYAPVSYSPAGYTGSSQAYASAQLAALMAISASPNTSCEMIIRNTWNKAENFYIRVLGREGAHSLTAPFQLKVTAVGGVCGNVAPITAAPTLEVSSGNYKTIILADYARMTQQYGDISALKAKLNEFKNRPEVQGVVVDVSAEGRVQAANLQADAENNVRCTYAKNLVAYEIKRIVDAYRTAGDLAGYPLEYVVIVGSDDKIPFFREPDRAELANEQQFVVPVLENTHSQASLKRGYVLSQDRYGSRFDVARDDTSIAFPGLAVGRLVETPDEIAGMLDAYLSTSDGVVPTPQSAFASGYDFLVHGATEVENELKAGLGKPVNTMISPQSLAPNAPACDPTASSFANCLWTADNLKKQVLNQRHDLMYLAGHFSASSALAADHLTELETHEVVASRVDMTNAVIFSAGCHSGYNVVDGHAVLDVTEQPDWAQAFAQKRATLIAGTGYQYGDTDFMEYAARLYRDFAKQLRYGNGPVSLGNALIEAKKDYLAGTVKMSGIHDKTVVQATLFGLPMLSVNMPSGRLSPSSDPSYINTLTDGFYADLNVQPTLTEKTATLVDATNPSQSKTAVYFVGEDGVVTNPLEPVLPLERLNVTVDQKVLRGVGFVGGSYKDLTSITLSNGSVVDVLPLTGAPATEASTVRIPFRSDIFYPITPWGGNYFDALDGGPTRLVVAPAQYKSSSPDSLTGTLRKHTSMDFRLFYSGAANAVAAPGPVISDVTAQPGSSNVTFQARVTGLTATDIKQVWVTYTSTSGSLAGTWHSLWLAPDANDPTLWKGSLTLPAGNSSADLRYMVQAVNAAGMVSLTTNLGFFFTPGVAPLYADTQPTPSQQPTSLTFTPSPTTATYGGEVTVAATLQRNGQAFGNQTLTFTVGSQRRQATTNTEGIARVTVPVVDAPGTVQVGVQFAGTADYAASAATGSLTITKRPATLVLNYPSTQSTGDIANVVATLTAQGGPAQNETALDYKAVLFSVSSGSTIVYRKSVITDFEGKARLGVVPLPVGSYSVVATFATGDQDTFYQQQTSNTLPIVVTTAQYKGDLVVTAGSQLNLAAVINGTTTAGAQVRFDVRNAVGARVAIALATTATEGIYKATTSGLSTGVYTIETVVIGSGFAATTPSIDFLAVYDPSAGFVTGGGWIDSPLGACELTVECVAMTGKANFGFVSKYQKGATVPTGNTQFQFKAGNLNFHSSSYEWLVVSGARAQYKGVGTINGDGNYGFILTAIDGQVNGGGEIDKFRIKIWEKNANGTDGRIVYDNQMDVSNSADPTTVIGGGSIVIRTK